MDPQFELGLHIHRAGKRNCRWVDTQLMSRLFLVLFVRLNLLVWRQQFDIRQNVANKNPHHLGVPSKNLDQYLKLWLAEFRPFALQCPSRRSCPHVATRLVTSGYDPDLALQLIMCLISIRKKQRLWCPIRYYLFPFLTQEEALFHETELVTGGKWPEQLAYTTSIDK